MKKTVVSIIALFTLALGTTGITNVLAAQNEKKENASDKTEIKMSEEQNTQNGLDSLIEERKDSEQEVQSLVTNLSVEQNILEPVSLDDEVKMTKEEPDNTVKYIVETGDTLVNIATAFEVEVSELTKWNESLASDSHLQIGELIEIETDLDPETIKPKKLTWEKEETVKNEAVLPEPKQETETAAIEETNTSVANESAETVTVVATAYSRNQPSLTNITAMGIDLSENPQVIAVDPNVIPLGTKVYVEGYGEAIAGDTGSAIIGNRVDLHMESMDESFAWGIKEVELTIID